MSRALRMAVVATLFVIPLAFLVPGHTVAARDLALTAPQATPAAAQAADHGDTTVYVTKTGKRYHADGCRSLSKSKIPIKLKDAVAKGYTACSICNPPALNASQTAAAEKTPPAAGQAAAPAVTQAGRTEGAKDNGDTIVYITRTGKKYHSAGCRSLAKSSIPIKLSEAVARGYGACSLCNPPTLTSSK
jgi:hypothetical protein